MSPEYLRSINVDLRRQPLVIEGVGIFRAGKLR